MTEKKIMISMILEIIVAMLCLASFLYAVNDLQRFCSLFVAMMSICFAFDNRRKIL